MSLFMSSPLHSCFLPTCPLLHHAEPHESRQGVLLHVGRQHVITLRGALIEELARERSDPGQVLLLSEVVLPLLQEVLADYLSSRGRRRGTVRHDGPHTGVTVHPQAE